MAQEAYVLGKYLTAGFFHDRNSGLKGEAEVCQQQVYALNSAMSKSIQIKKYLDFVEIYVPSWSPMLYKDKHVAMYAIWLAIMSMYGPIINYISVLNIFLRQTRGKALKTSFGVWGNGCAIIKKHIPDCDFSWFALGRESSYVEKTTLSSALSIDAICWGLEIVCMRSLCHFIVAWCRLREQHRSQNCDNDSTTTTH